MARILIAAKSGPVRKAVRAMLVAEGHILTCVEHGGEAYQALGGAPYDLVIADAKMPVMDGIALSLAVKDDYPQVGVLLMTDNPQLANILSAIDVFVDGMIAKPFSVQGLRREVKRLVPAASEAA